MREPVLWFIAWNAESRQKPGKKDARMKIIMKRVSCVLTAMILLLSNISVLGADIREHANENQLIEDMLGFDEAFADIFSGSALLAETASGSCRELLLRKADEALNDIPVDELKHTRSGIRTQMLKDAGYLTLYDLHRAGDEVLLAIPGIGEKQLASIRAVTEEFQQQLFEKAVLTLDADRPDALTLRTITDLVRSRQAELVRADAEPLREEVREQITGAVSSIEIRSGLRWVFSLGKTRMRTLDGIRQLTEFAGSPLFSRARHFLSAYGKAAGITEDEALSDFRKNSAAVYAAAEKLSGVCAPARLLYNSIPEQLAASVQAVGLLTGSFRGDLRAYQAFGVRYILHQKKYTSLPKGIDPMTITLDEAIALIEEKRKQESQKFLRAFDADGKLQILNGRYGPYIVYDGKNYRMPKALHQRAAELTYDECMKIVEGSSKKK